MYSPPKSGMATSAGERLGGQEWRAFLPLKCSLECSACLSLDSLSLLLPEFLSPSTSIYRWLGTFTTAAKAGQAYDAAAIARKGCKAKTNFRYLNYTSIPCKGAETLESVGWKLLPEEAAEVRKGSQCGYFQTTSHVSVCVGLTFGSFPVHELSGSTSLPNPAETTEPRMAPWRAGPQPPEPSSSTWSRRAPGKTVEVSRMARRQRVGPGALCGLCPAPMRPRPMPSCSNDSADGASPLAAFWQ